MFLLLLYFVYSQINVRAFVFKYVGDSVIISFLNGLDNDHGPVLDGSVYWCDKYILQINASKTKEMFITFQRRPCLPARVIKRELVATVQQYKYLGTVLDDKLTSDVNTDVICKKANQ